MDPFLLSLAVAIGTGISNVAGKIIDKGVDVLVEPAVNEFKARAQKDLKAKEKENALAQAILAAIKDSSKQKDESLIVTYARRLTLHRLIEPSNEPLRDEIVRLMFLAHAPDPNLIPQSVLDALHLSAEMRLSLATFLFHLRRRLSDVPEFKPL
ncbi:MAG: hypothetical protein HY070_07615, partial [Chloroflexi bacterium]|nr:hypothetical protein [Chloroflexota bacterium]